MTTQNLGTYIREQTKPGLEAVGGFVRMCVRVGRALCCGRSSGGSSSCRAGS